MATKQMLQADGVSLDPELDFDGSADFDVQNQADAGIKSNSRSPVLQAFKNAAIGAFDGAKSKATDPAVLQKAVETALPKQYGEIFAQYNEIADGVVELYNDAVKKIRPTFSRAVRQVDRLIPTESVRTRGFLEKVKDFVGDDVDYTPPSKEQMENSTVNNTLSAIFKLQTDEQIRQRNEDQAEERIREQVETTRHDATSQTFNNIDANLSRLTQYNEKITQAFQKKSLELQFRGYFLQQEMLSTTRKFFGVFQTQNEAVIKNTALPEYAKITQFESYKENSRQRFVEQVRSGLFGDGEFVKKGLANIRTAAIGKVGDFASAFEEGLTTAEMAADAIKGDDDDFEFGDDGEEKSEEQKQLDKIKNNMKSVAEYATEEGMYKLGSMVRAWIEKSEKKLPTLIREEGFRGASAVHSLPGLFENFRKSKLLEESYEDDFVKGKSKELLRWGLDQFLKDDIQTALTADAGITKLTGPAIFDNKIYRSISEIIPGYLAHILRELQVTRTGNEDLGLTEFNFISGKFTSKKGIADSIKSRLKTASQAFSYSKDLDEMRDTVLEGGEFSEETKKQVGEFLRDMSFAKKRFDPKLISQDPRFDRIPANERKALQEFLEEKYAPEGLGAAENIYKFSSGMRSLKSSIADIRGQIELISNAGYDDILEELDIIKRRGRFKNINVKAFKKLTMDEETEREVDREEDLERIKAGLPPRGPKRSWDDVPTDLAGNETLEKLDAILDQLKNLNSTTALSDIEAKENITPVDPKQALDNIKNTPVFNWKYKDGRGDGQEHVGPMAQDVHKSMGEDAAPGGKKIDLVSMNGQTMAAIEGLRQEFENFKDKASEAPKASENYSPLLTSIKKDTGKLVELMSDKGIKISSMPNFGGFGGFGGGGGYAPLGNQWFNFQRLFGLMASAGNTALDVGDKIGQTMKPIIQDQANKMPGRLNTLGNLLSSGIAGATSMGSLLGGKLLNAGGQALKTGKEVGGAIGQTILEKFQEFKNPMKEGLGGILSLFMGGAGGAGKAAPGLFANKENAGKLIKFLLMSSPMGRLLTIGEMAGGMLGLSKNKLLGSALNAFGGIFGGGMGKHGGKIYKVLKDIREVLNTRLPGEPMVFDEDPGDDSSLTEKMAGLGSKILGDSPIGDIASKMRDKTNELFGNVIPGGVGKSSAPEAVTKLAKAGQAFMQKNAPNAYKSAQEAAGGWVQKATDNVSGGFAKAASGDFSGLVPNLKDTANSTAASAKEALNNIRTNPMGAAANAVSSVTGAMQTPLGKAGLASLKVPVFAAKMMPKAIIPAMGMVGGPMGMAAGGVLAGTAGLAGLTGVAGYAGVKQAMKLFGSKQGDIEKAKQTISGKLNGISESNPSAAAKGMVESASSRLKEGLSGVIPTKTPIETSSALDNGQVSNPEPQEPGRPLGMFDKLTTAAGQFVSDMKENGQKPEDNYPRTDPSLGRVIGLLQEIRDILDVKLEGGGSVGKMPSNATRQGNVHDRMKQMELRKLQQKSNYEVPAANNSAKYRTGGNSVDTVGKVASTLWGTKVDGLVVGKDGNPGKFGKLVNSYVPVGKAATLGALATGYAATRMKDSKLGEFARSSMFDKFTQQAETKLDEQRLEKTTKEELDDPRKIDTPEEVKEVVGDMLNKQERKKDDQDPAFNDRDDDGDRDGNYTERLEEIERRKQEREAARNNQAADNSAKYKSSENVIDKLLGGAKSIVGVGAGGLGLLGGAGGVLGGLASLGGLLGGRGNTGPTPTVPGSIPGAGGPQTTVPGTQPSKLKMLASRGLKMGAGAGAAYGAFELAEQARANGNETLADSLSMVGNLAGAYTAFQGLSGLANMVAGTANKTSLFGKMVGAAGSVGSAASSLVGGTTGLVGRAGLSLLGGLGGALASSTFLIPAAVALTAYSGYKLYKYMKKSNLIPLEQYRFAQYGLAPSDTDQISAVYALENYFAENALGYNTNKEAYLIEKNIDPKKIADIFGIGENDKDAISKFLHWYEIRFKPIYLSHLTALIKVSSKTRLEDVRDLEPHLKEKYLKAIAYPDGPYDDTTSPFIDLKQLTATRSTVASIFATASKSVMDELGKEEKPATEKEAPKKMADFLSKPEDKKEEVASTDTSLWGNTKDVVSGLISGVSTPLIGTYGGKVAETVAGAAKTAKEVGGGFVEGVTEPIQASLPKPADVAAAAKDSGIDWATGLSVGAGALGIGQGLRAVFSKKKPETSAATPTTAAPGVVPDTPPKPKSKLGIIASRGTKLGLGAGAAYGLATLAEQARANGNETLADSLSMGANVAGAYSAFQGLSGVANMVAGTANKTSLFGKMIGAAGSVGSAASSLVGGTTGLVGRAGLSLLGGMGSMLMSTAVLAPAAVGLALYGGYKAYKYYKKKNPTSLDKFRFSQYGFSESSPNKDQYYGSAQELEQYFNENALAYKDGQAYLMEKNIKPEEVLSIMGISPTDKEGQVRAIHWLTKRFKPIYLSHMTALAAISPKTRLEDINSLSPEQKEKYLKAVAFPEGPYDELLAPAANQANLTADRSYVASYYQKAYNDVASEAGKKPTDTTTKLAAVAKETAVGATWLGKDVVASATKAVGDFSVADKGQMADKALKDTSSWVKDFSKNIAAGTIPVSLINFTKQIKRPDDAPPTSLEMVRFKMYGLTDITALKVSDMRAMEAYVANATSIDNSLKVKVSIDGIQLLRDIGGIFRVHESDGERSKKWLTWYFKRFLPIFTMYIGEGYRLVQKTTPTAIETLMTNKQVYELAVKIASISESWNTQISPYVDEPANVNTSSVNGNLAYLEERAAFKLVDDKTSVKQEFDPLQKSAGEKMESAVSEKNTSRVVPDNLPTDKTQSQVTPASLPAPAGVVKSAIFSQNVESEPKAKLDKKPVEQDNTKSPQAFTDRIPNVGGAIKDGRGGMQYVKLEKADVDLSGMSPAFMTNFLGMAQEYGEKTGKSILVTSAYRSYEKQAQLKREDPSAASPGNSVHNYGIGMDISSINANQLESMGLMRKYGFTRPIGKELWHIEPAGIQTRIELAKKDKQYAEKAISASLNLGGGGAAMVSSIPKGRRNLEIAKSSIGAAEKQMPQEKAEDTVLANAGGNIKPAKFEPNQKPQPTPPSDQTTKPEFGFMKAALTAASAPVGMAGFRTASYGTPKDSADTSLVPKPENNSGFIKTKLGVSPAYDAGEAEPKNTDAFEPKLKKPSSRKEEVKEQIAKASLEVGANPAVMQTFAAKESSLDPNAIPPKSNARGVFQFMPKTWKMMADLKGSKYGITENTPRTDVRASTIMAAEYAKLNANQIKDIRPNPNATELYLTHMLGGGGASRLLSADPNAPAKDILPKADTVGNRSMFWDGQVPRTVAGYYNNTLASLKKAGAEFGIRFEDKPITGPKIAQTVKPSSPTQPGFNGSYSGNTEPGSIPGTVRTKTKVTDLPPIMSSSSEQAKSTTEPTKEYLPTDTSSKVKMAALGGVAAATVLTPAIAGETRELFPVEERSKPPLLVPESTKPEVSVSNADKSVEVRQDYKELVPAVESTQTLEPSNGTRDIRNSPQGYMTKHTEQVVVSKPSYRYYDSNNNDVVDVRTTVVPAIPGSSQPQRLVIDINVKLTNKVSEVVAEQIKSIDKLPELQQPVTEEKPTVSSSDIYEEDAIDKLLGTDTMRKKLEEPEIEPELSQPESTKPAGLGELIKAAETKETADTLPEAISTPVQVSDFVKAEILPPIGQEDSLDEIIKRAIGDKADIGFPELDGTSSKKSTEISVDDSLADGEQFVYPDGFVKTGVTVTTVPDKTKLEAVPLPLLPLADSESSTEAPAEPKVKEESNFTEETPTNGLNEIASSKADSLELVPKQVVDIVTDLFDKLKQVSKKLVDDREEAPGKVEVSIAETNSVATPTKPTDPAPQTKQTFVTPKKANALGEALSVPVAFGDQALQTPTRLQKQPLDQVAGNNLASHTETVSIILNESLSVQRQILSVLKNILEKEPVKIVEPKPARPSEPPVPAPQVPAIKQASETQEVTSPYADRPQPLGRPAVSLRRTTA